MRRYKTPRTSRVTGEKNSPSPLSRLVGIDSIEEETGGAPLPVRQVCWARVLLYLYDWLKSCPDPCIREYPHRTVVVDSLPQRLPEKFFPEHQW